MVVGAFSAFGEDEMIGKLLATFDRFDVFADGIDSLRGNGSSQAHGAESLKSQFSKNMPLVNC